jgi:hypothetical protein
MLVARDRGWGFVAYYRKQAFEYGWYHYPPSTKDLQQTAMLAQYEGDTVQEYLRYGKLNYNH